MCILFYNGITKKFIITTINIPRPITPLLMSASIRSISVKVRNPAQWPETGRRDHPPVGG
jgi:hypothetical protein